MTSITKGIVGLKTEVTMKLEHPCQDNARSTKIVRKIS